MACMLIVTLGKTNFGERLRSFKRQVMCLTSAVRIIWVPGYVCIWNVIRKYEFQAGICCPESEANVPYVGWLKVWIPFTWKSSDSSNNIHSYILEYIMCVCVCVYIYITYPTKTFLFAIYVPTCKYTQRWYLIRRELLPVSPANQFPASICVVISNTEKGPGEPGCDVGKTFLYKCFCGTVRP